MTKITYNVFKIKNNVNNVYFQDVNVNNVITSPITPLHPRHPLDISREQEMSIDAKRHRQMYSNSTCQCLWVSGAVCLCLVASVVVCWHLLLPRNVCWVSGGCLVSVWGCQRDIHGDRRHSDVFGIIWVLSPCSMEP